MVEAVIKLKVIDGEVQLATSDIEKLGQAIDTTEKKAKKAGGEIKKTGGNIEEGFGKAEDSVNNLNNGLEGGVKEAVKLGKAAKVSGAAMRSALISTGIGALVVALGFVVSHWEEIGELLGFINKDLENQHVLLESNLSVLDSELKLLKKQEKFNKDNNKSNEENLHNQKLLLIEKKRILAIDIANLEAQLLKEQSAASELNIWQKFKQGVAQSVGTILPQVNLVDAEEQLRLDEITKQLNVLKGVAVDTSLELKNVGKEPEKKAGKVKARDKQVSVDAGIEQGISDPFNEQKEKDALRLQALREGTEEFAIAQNEQIDLEVQGLIKSAEIQNKKTQDEKDNADARIRIADAEFQAKQMLLDGISGSLDAVSEIVGRQTAAGKALAVASALIDTYASIAGQLKAFSGVPVPGFAIAQAVATGLAGFAAVKNILKVKVPYDKGGGSGSFAGGGGGGASAPSFNVVGTSGVNQLAQTLNQEQQPIQAFVVGGDVTSQQEFERNVVETSSI
jgi:hypothetical protein